MAIKDLLFRHYRCFNHLPFLNRIHPKKGILTVENKGAILYHVQICASGKNNRVIFESDSILKHTVISLFGDNNTVVFGKNIRSNFGDFYLEDNGNTLTVGEGTQFAGKIHIAVTEGKTVSVGKDCLFSSDIVFRTGDSHSIFDKDRKARINPGADIKIGDRVWIGHRAMLTKGASIANDSVVGTGAVVTKKFETPNVILAGVPAKIVKENIVWDV